MNAIVLKKGEVRTNLNHTSPESQSAQSKPSKDLSEEEKANYPKYLGLPIYIEDPREEEPEEEEDLSKPKKRKKKKRMKKNYQQKI